MPINEIMFNNINESTDSESTVYAIYKFFNEIKAKDKQFTLLSLNTYKSKTPFYKILVLVFKKNVTIKMF